jgi:hypothetical protein
MNSTTENRLRMVLMGGGLVIGGKKKMVRVTDEWKN